MIRSALPAALFLTSALSFSGCVTDFLYETGNPLSTAASMRVEVEVYKGPLSKNVSVQWGELDGLVEEAADALTNFNDTIIAVAVEWGYVTDCTTCKATYCDTTCAVTDCTTCETKVTINPHYRSAKIKKQNEESNRDGILPRTMLPEIDTRIVEKIGNTRMHEHKNGTRSEEKVLWCARDSLREDGHELVWCRTAATMHDDIRVLLEELNRLHETMMQHSNSGGPINKLPKEATENFATVYGFIITAKDKIDRLKDSCPATCDPNDALFAIRMDLEEAKALLKKDKEVWNNIKRVSHALGDTLADTTVNLEDNPAAKVIPDEAIELSQRMSAKVLSSIESVEGIIGQVTAETHLPLFATHPSTAAEWSRDLERAANEMRKLSNFLFKQVHSCQNLDKASCEQRKRIMERAGRVAIKLKAKAMYWAETHASAAPRKRSVRVAMAAFANLAAEYSNQLASLADALQWQLGENGEKVPAKQLPLSIYLRNAEKTDFLNLYTWNRAVSSAIWEEILLHPFNAFTSSEIADRVRIIERLYADHNWQKINTVYGSGQGDFSMALIKDEIGNWNLKSFDTDPSELLNAYKDLIVGSMKTSASLFLNDGSAMNRLVRSIGNLTRGEIDGSARLSGELNTNTLHKRVAEKLGGIKVPEQEQCPVQCPVQEADAKAEVLRQIQTVLDDYKATIDLLQESFMSSQLTTNGNSK